MYYEYKNWEWEGGLVFLFVSVYGLATKNKNRKVNNRFALISLYYLPVSWRYKVVLLCCGMACGWYMGIYQMARGEHFVSHTLMTMFLALTLITLIAKIMNKRESYR